MPTDWVWEGYLRQKSITLLTGQWKAGKTTLLVNLLARLGKGGTLAGRAVKAGKTLVLSEESDMAWLERLDRYGIGDEVTFGFGFDLKRTDRTDWDRMMADLELRQCERLEDLVVLDTLGTILPPGVEGHAGQMTDALRPLRSLSRLGAAVLLVHLPRKGSPGYGQKARGSGALPAGVDVLLEFDWAGPRTAENRRRVMRAWSRQAATPPRVLMELNADGTDYTVLADAGPADADAEPPAVLLELLRAADGRTAQEALAAWPSGEPMPSRRTLSRWLADLEESGWLTRTGRGSRFDPYRYRVA